MTILSLLLITISPFFLATNTWNGITPLESARADVEKIIGKPKPNSKSEDAASYKTENEEVFVLYSTGNCKIKPSNGWNIEKGKVIRISTYLFKPLKFSDYKFDESKFYHYVEDVVSLTTYTNSKDGVGFVVNTDEGMIGGFNYFPKAEDRYLLCDKKKS